MKTLPRPLLTLLAAVLFGGTNPAHSAVTADGVVSIDANSTPGTILASFGTVDLALNFGATSGATINGISFTGTKLVADTPVIGAGATLTPTAPTPIATTLRNLDLSNFLWTTTGDFAGVMNDAVDTNRYPAVAGDAHNLTISGLDANRFYFIQLLSGDKRAEFENQNYNLGGVVQNGQFGNGDTNDGVLVKFTVIGQTTVNLSVSNVTGNSPPMLAGILIRSVAPGLFGPATANGTSAGLPSTLNVQIGNGASTAYKVTGSSFSGANAGDFSNGSTLPLSVPAGGNANLTVNVNPAAGGTRTATLTLTTNDPAVPTIDVKLSVIVTDPGILIEPSVNFGAHPTLPGPTAGVAYVDNNGAATNLSVSKPVLSGPGAAAFSITSLPAPIAPGAFDSVGVSFNPTSPGYYAAVLGLTTNDPFTPTVTVKLSGEVTGNMILPVTVTSVSSALTQYGRDAANSVNGNGLTGLGSAGSSHSIGESGLVWTTSGNIIAPNDLDPQVTYDLGAVHQVTKIREWGYNDPTVNLVLGTSATIMGPNLVEIFTSKDNVTFTSAGTVNFALAPGTSGYTGNEIAVNLPAARYIRFAIKSNHAGALFDGTGANPGTTDNRGLTGLSEVRFEGTPSTVISTPFESWLDGHSLAGANRAPNADPDHDSTPNLVEFVTGGNPTTSGTDRLPQSAVIGGNLTVTFNRPDSVSGVAIRFEVGTNLVNWPDVFTVGTSPEITIVPNGSAPDTITLTLPQTGQPKRFVRLVAELTP